MQRNAGWLADLIPVMRMLQLQVIANIFLFLIVIVWIVRPRYAIESKHDCQKKLIVHLNVYINNLFWAKVRKNYVCPP